MQIIRVADIQWGSHELHDPANDACPATLLVGINQANC